MAVNPMQRKANNSFLLGMLITLLITGIVIGLLVMQLSKINKEQKAAEARKVDVYVLSTTKKSGEIISGDDFKKVRVSKDTIPENAITSPAELENHSLCDSQGRDIIVRQNDAGEEIYALRLNNEQEAELALDEETGKYYYSEQSAQQGTIQKVFIKLDSKTLIAKVDLNANTIVTPSVLTKGAILSADIRKQEYNVITLPTQIQTGDYIDVRLTLPTGQDYIVVSHKEVTVPLIAGVPSRDSIWIELSEADILNMSNAIVEAYRANGAKLYATRYVEAGMQAAATVTYIPSTDVMKLIEVNPNIVTEAKNALVSRYNSQGGTIRPPINNAINNDDADDNVNDGVKNEIQGIKDEREQYLESLSE